MLFRNTLFTLAVGVFNAFEGSNHAVEALQVQRLQLSKVGLGKLGVQRVQLEKKGLFKNAKNWVSKKATAAKNGMKSLKKKVANSSVGKAVGKMKNKITNSKVGKAMGSMKKKMKNALGNGKKWVSRRFKNWKSKYTLLLGKASAKAWVTLDETLQAVVSMHAEVERLAKPAVRDSERSEDIKIIETAIERPKDNRLYGPLNNKLTVYEMIAQHQIANEQRVVAAASFVQLAVVDAKKKQTLEDGIKSFKDHEAKTWGQMKDLCDKMLKTVEQTGKNTAWKGLQSTVQFVCAQLMSQMKTVNDAHSVTPEAPTAAAVAPKTEAPAATPAPAPAAETKAEEPAKTEKATDNADAATDVEGVGQEDDAAEDDDDDDKWD